MTKKIQTLLTALVLTATTFAQDVVINETNFPDKNFRNYLLEQSYGKYGIITATEIANIVNISVSSKGISDLTGIEYFTALKILNCSYNQLNFIDVSVVPNLLVFSCNNNQLTSIDISALTNLLEFNCSDNKLTSIDLTANIELTDLSCGRNELTSLDLSHLKNLRYLYCYYNQLSSLVVSGLVNLKYLYCYDNKLTSLDLSGLTNLYYLRCQANQLTSLDLSGLTNLRELYCQNNRLTSLDVSNLVNVANDFYYNPQNPILTLTGIGNKYSLEIALNNPIGFADGISYENGKLISASNDIFESNFQIDIIQRNGYLGSVNMYGVVHFEYVDCTHDCNETGVTETKKLSIKLYPNPTKDELRIESGDLRIDRVKIVDISGKVICQFNDLKNQINVSSFGQGVYFVIIETDKDIVKEIFIKE